MVLTESAPLQAGQAAPDFELLEPLTGKTVRLADFHGGRALLLMILCNHCPFVVHLKGAISTLAKEYQDKGVRVVAISSSSAQTHPEDGPEEMAKDAKANGYTFPYLYDESQEVAKALKGACTPEFFVFDANLKLKYHGQFDGSRPNNNSLVTGKDLRAALDAVLQDKEVPKAKPSIGCNIKWHPGT